MARAKKTDRADARRRARLAAVVPEPDEGSPDASQAGPSTGAPSTAGSGIRGAFAGAIRPIDIRSDLRQVGWLVTRTPSVWLPSLLVLGTAIWFGTSGGALSGLPGTAFNLFVFPPPLAAAFLAGVLTERMSYLAGLLVGVVAAIVFSVYMLIGPIAGVPLTVDQRQGYILYALVVSPISGLVIGGFAGFYRRFLRRANPNAARRQQARAKGTKATARR